jgi:hypothetical protein
MRPAFMARLALGALVLLVGASGCKEFKYFDIHVSFNPAMFDVVSVGTIDHCKLFVSGADSGEFLLNNDSCPNRMVNAPDKLNAGTFEYSTFADSGNLTFTVRAWQGGNETDACKLGEGATTVPVKAAMTNTGAVVIDKAGNGCL